MKSCNVKFQLACFDSPYVLAGPYTLGAVRNLAQACLNMWTMRDLMIYTSLFAATRSRPLLAHNRAGVSAGILADTEEFQIQALLALSTYRC